MMCTAAAAAAAAASGDTTGFWAPVPAPLFAAAIAALVAVVLHTLKAKAEHRARARELYAEAYQWYAAYKEFPYAIRRRSPDEPAAERVRLSEAVRDVQAKLDYFRVWTALENAVVGASYADLLAELRRIAGTSMHDAWTEPAAADDTDMNFPPGRVDLAALASAEQRYLDAVRRAVEPWWRRPRQHAALLTTPSQAPPADS